MLSNRVYDILKFLAQVLLPALATLLFALGSVWDFPADRIAGTVTAADAFLGALLGISSARYNSRGG